MKRNTMLQRLTTAALVLTLSTPALAQSSNHDARQLELLGAIDLPVTARAMHTLDLQEDDARAILQDAKLRRYVRARALTALAILDTPSARATLEKTARTHKDVELRIQAVYCIASTQGTHSPQKVDAFLVSLRKDAPKKLQRYIDLRRSKLPQSPTQ